MLVIVMGLGLIGVGARFGAQREAQVHWRPRTGLLGAPAARLGVRARLGTLHRADARRRLVMASPSQDPQVARGAGLVVACRIGVGLPHVLVTAGLDRAGLVSGCCGGTRAPSGSSAVRCSSSSPSCS